MKFYCETVHGIVKTIVIVDVLLVVLNLLMVSEGPVDSN